VCEFASAGLFTWMRLINIGHQPDLATTHACRTQEGGGWGSHTLPHSQLGSPPMVHAPAEKQQLFFRTE
jgi:hypothetical protein